MGGAGIGRSGGKMDARRSGIVETGIAGATAEDSASGSLSVEGERRSKYEGEMSSCFKLTRRVERGVVGRREAGLVSFRDPEGEVA